MTVDAIGGLAARSALTGLPAPMGTVEARAHLAGSPLTGIAPLAPLLLTPSAGSAVDFTASATFTWTPLAPNGALQTAYAFRRYAAPSGPFQWWDAATAAWSAVEVYNPSATAAVTFPIGSWANGQLWGWSVATQNGATLGGPYALSQALAGAAAPVVTFTGPTATQTSGDWTITWAASVSTLQATYRVVVYSSAQVAAAGWTPGSSPSMADSGVVGGVASSFPVSLLPPDTYTVCIQVTDLTGTASPWTTNTVLVSYVAPTAPTVSVVWTP